MQLPILGLALLASAFGVQAAGKPARVGESAVNQGPEYDSVEGFRKPSSDDLTTIQQVCPPRWPRPCPDGVWCCSNAYPWCCNRFCCPNGYRYCGRDGRCYARP
ncbi:hypothetical protein DL770_008906 [Monosporascus sp. CRB-9-2]|nr:hypothetical protein DL770_008906 [Monosporascus sp. CRB-9-2]